jgi:hypothetical protein
MKSILKMISLFLIVISNLDAMENNSVVNTQFNAYTTSEIKTRVKHSGLLVRCKKSPVPEINQEEIAPELALGFYEKMEQDWTNCKATCKETCCCVVSVLGMFALIHAMHH